MQSTYTKWSSFPSPHSHPPVFPFFLSFILCHVGCLMTTMTWGRFYNLIKFYQDTQRLYLSAVDFRNEHVLRCLFSTHNFSWFFYRIVQFFHFKWKKLLCKTGIPSLDFQNKFHLAALLYLNPIKATDLLTSVAQVSLCTCIPERKYTSANQHLIYFKTY